MEEFHRWVLTDVRAGMHLDSLRVSASSLGLRSEFNWSIHKRTLRGGLSDGVELIEVDADPLHFIVLPTRGMGIWRGSCRGRFLGWHSPVKGPVHPAFVNLADHGGLGWLAGFDEWIVRCGLSSNGPPGQDVVVDAEGNKREATLPLHGRIANLPAHYVEIRVSRREPHAIEIVGVVDESALFLSQLQLETTIRVEPGAKTLSIRDQVTNFKSGPSEMQLLYHCNFGPPLLAEGSTFHAPIQEMAPRDRTAAKGVDRYARYPAPIPGVAEEAFYFDLLADPADGRTLALLADKDRKAACAIRFSKRQLPWFTLWKNPGAISDGYVTGLEPATNFPNPKRFEREQGRVVRLDANKTREHRLDVEIADSADDVEKLIAEVDRLQRAQAPAIHSAPRAGFSPT